ncbi:MAG: hypothetical protein IT190_05010 [Microbacteriaceae bacterium]|nr:hypothetical protein [Microbacteriaceae bacterium]
MKVRPAYYSVYAARDGTIVMALPSRKPARHSRERGPVADEDGCFNWSEWDHERQGYTDWANGVVHSAIVNQLNLKKALRAHVESRLDRIEASLAEMAAVLRLLEFSAMTKLPDQPPTAGNGAEFATRRRPQAD